MSDVKILQYTHHPNATELGLGNTHETYMLINTDIDLTEMFPPQEVVVVEDMKEHKQYSLKAAKGREYRVNQMGELYRDYKVRPGDVVVITKIIRNGCSKVFFEVKSSNQVVLNVSNKGVDLSDIGRLSSFEVANKIYEVTIEYKGIQENLRLTFKESMKKRADSPNLTDFYVAKINNEDLPNGKYSLSLDGKPTLQIIGKNKLEVTLINEELLRQIHKSDDETSNKAVLPTEDNIEFLQTDYEYMAAIKTKPFLILGGFSGTGKSRDVKALAFATCPCDGVLNMSETSPGNYLLLSVKPNWHDATDITGFRSSVNQKYYVTDFMRFLVKAKMYEEKKIPFFVCLDEMNLAPVEEYFANFLSVIESRKRRKDGLIVTDPIVPASVFNDKGYSDDFNIFMDLGLKTVNETWKPDDINELSTEEASEAFVRQDIVDELKREGLTIPQNIVIIGTVNMDDTTNSFSRKVIDRAMTFETVIQPFGQDYFIDDISLCYLKNPRRGDLFISDEVFALDMLSNERFTLNKSEKERIIRFINGVNSDLEGTPFKVSYRILNETILLYHSKKEIAHVMEDEEGGFEKNVVFQPDLNSIFDDILMQKVLPRIEGDYEKCHDGLDALLERARANEWKRSFEKIEFMIKRFGKDHSGFTTFWN